jgi:hypothetical protein
MIHKIMAEYQGKIDALEQKVAKLKDERKVAVEKVLTEDQLKRLKELRLGEKIKEPEKPKEVEKPKDKG